MTNDNTVDQAVYSKAGLFSAVLTTFNVQSYLLLQPAAPDPSIVVLRQIASQLASLSSNSPLVNATQSSGSGNSNSNTPPVVPRWVVWLNPCGSPALSSA